MDVSRASSLSMASLYALFGQAMPVGAQATGAAGVATPAHAIEAPARAPRPTRVGARVEGVSGGAAPLARSLASLSVLDPAVELARLAR